MREAAACLRGISKRFGDSLEAYFARKHHDKKLELEMEKAFATSRSPAQIIDELVRKEISAASA